MRILLLICGCLVFLGCQPNHQGDHSQGSSKADEHQSIHEEAEKEPLIRAQRPAFTSLGLRINHIQFVGSHNSYKQAMSDGFVKQLMKVNPKVMESLEYEHAPLAEQLDLGIRKLELDIFYSMKIDFWLVMCNKLI